MSNKKLFVGGISWDSTEDSLREAFSKFGPVESVKIVTDRDTGKSRGFGFVEYADADDAKEAMDSLNDTFVDGRKIRVNEATDKRPRSGGNRGDGYRNRDNDGPVVESRRGGYEKDRGDRWDRGGGDRRRNRGDR
jgi:cold-inducible RNA-binding protein